MYGTDLYRRLAAETGTDPSWHEVGSLRLASSPERFEELRRQAGWAKTFGLPLDLVTAAEARDALPADVHQRRRSGRSICRLMAGWIPAGLAQALAAGARARGASIQTHTRVVAIHAEGDRVTGVTVEHEGDRREIGTEVVINAGGHVRRGDRADGRRDRAAHPDGSPVPVHRGDRRRSLRAAAVARPGQPRLLPRGSRRPVHGRLRARSGAVEPGRDPGRLQRQAPGSGHGPLRADHGGRHPARTGHGGGPGEPGHQRSRSVHAGQRVHPRRIGGSWLLGRGRVLGPRDRGRRWDRPPDGDLDRRW